GSKRGLSHLHKYIIIGVSLGLAAGIVLSSLFFYITKKYRFRKQDQESNQDIDKVLLNHGSLAPKRYNYNEIKKITKSFKDKLGRGAYGIVYKGKLPGDGQLVAVKVLTESDNDTQDFINEVASISKTSHVNIVNLLGFCYDSNKRALVYEYMPNKSLDNFLSSNGRELDGRELEWEKMYEIAVGVARGLEYLHRGCNTRIVHFDIKPQNILLDEDFCPKISDFGLAKLFRKKQSILSMLGMRGTIGYIAPEVFSRSFGVVSHKSDVYSYGMMLLEMAGAKKIVETEIYESGEDFFHDRIYDHVLLESEKLDCLMTEESDESARKMLLVGVWCIQIAPSDRPSMTKVLEMLEGSVGCIQIPPKPFISTPMLSPQTSSSSSATMEIENLSEG
ncbi:probable receptor-like protein kinase at5g39030, partial [Phtheirospermum japonicum]